MALMIRRLRLFLFIVCFLPISNLKAQKTFTIEYIYKKTKQFSDSFYFQLLKPAEGIIEIPIKNRVFKIKETKLVNIDTGSNGTICTYLVSDTSCGIIFDGYGYETFVIPGDTLRVYVEKKNKIDNKYWVNYDKNVQSVWFYNYSFKGKNRYIYSIFDSLAYSTDILLYKFITLQEAGLNLDSLLHMATGLYVSRLEYLDRYCLTYRIPEKIRQLVSSEIKSAYIRNLLQPMVNVITSFSVNDYSKEYIRALSTFNDLTNEDLCFKTLMYSDAVYQYIALYDLKFSYYDTIEEKKFQRIHQIINEIEGSNKRIKEHLLSYYLLVNLTRNFVSFPSFLREFKTTFPDSRSSQYLDSLYLNWIATPVVTLNQALDSSFFSNPKGEKTSFRRLLQKKPVLIDCWASWCKPCIDQMKFSEEIKIEYRDKIDLVYLSFDKDKEAWLTKNSQLKLDENSYLLDKNFTSFFAKHFEIGGIPRYIILGSNGSVIAPNAPRPSQKEALRKILNDAMVK